MIIVQIGCGTCEDDVFNFIKEHHNEIEMFVVIDALIDCVEKAKKVYSFLGDKLIALNCAVAPVDGLFYLWYPCDEEQSGHASLNPEHVLRHKHPKIDKIAVPCVSLNGLLNSIKSKVDRLYIDIEGFDVDVLLSLDLNRFKPDFIQYEFYHSDGTFCVGEKNTKLYKKLTSEGYDINQVDEYNLNAILIKK